MMTTLHGWGANLHIELPLKKPVLMNMSATTVQSFNMYGRTTFSDKFSILFIPLVQPTKVILKRGETDSTMWKNQKFQAKHCV